MAQVQLWATLEVLIEKACSIGSFYNLKKEIFGDKNIHSLAILFLIIKVAKNIKCTFLLYIVDISDDFLGVIKARLMIHCRLSMILKAVRKEVYEVIF